MMHLQGPFVADLITMGPRLLRTSGCLMVVTLYLALIARQSSSMGSDQGQPSGTFYYHKRIAHPSNNYFYKTLGIPPSSKINVKYNITFKTDRCCPILRFGIQRHSTRYFTNYYRDCATINYAYTSLYSPYYIYTKNMFPHSGCEIILDSHVCTGTRRLAYFRPIYWTFEALYECPNTIPLDVTVNFEIQHFLSPNRKCEPFHNELCNGFFNYSYTSFPNAIGQTSQKQANDLLVFSLSVFSAANCYKNIRLLACSALFSECRNGKVIYPCSELCFEAIEACRESLLYFQHFAPCQSLPRRENGDCIYQPVTCPQLQPPQFGKVVTKGLVATNISMYSCDYGYNLIGDDIRHCQYSGSWNGTEPACKSNSSTQMSSTEKRLNDIVLKVIVPVGISSILVLISISLGICYRDKIKLLILYNVHMDAIRGGGLPEEKKLFITYSSEDIEEVNESFIPELREQLPSWNPLTYQLDFLAGNNIQQSMEDAVWQSHGVLVLLTENYIKSGMCIYEFHQAEARSVTDKEFRLIVILFIKKNKKTVIELIGDLPENLRNFIQNRVYLVSGEHLFWNRLRRSLSR